MTYELAKELKDAGFPHIRIDEYFEHRVGSHSDDYGGSSDYPCYCNKDKFPTLEELIEACVEWICLSARVPKRNDPRGKDENLRVFAQHFECVERIYKMQPIEWYDAHSMYPKCSKTTSFSYK